MKDSLEFIDDLITQILDRKYEVLQAARRFITVYLIIISNSLINNIITMAVSIACLCVSVKSQAFGMHPQLIANIFSLESLPQCQLFRFLLLNQYLN